MVIGVVGGVLTSETWWRRSRPARGGGRPQLRAGWFAGRGICGLPRGIHEAAWGLFFVNILGRDSMVGILAIAIPFGAITAKVYAELIDESAQGPDDALRAAGAGRVSALAYAVFPRSLPDLVSYAFYRLECSIRSAVILGMIGAGGLGFELNLTFQSLRYREMWTLIYALVAISTLSDVWGAGLRRRATPRRVRFSVVGGVALVIGSFVQLQPDLGRLFSMQTRALFTDIAGRSWPPASPADGWPACSTARSTPCRCRSWPSHSAAPSRCSPRSWRPEVATPSPVGPWPAALACCWSSPGPSRPPSGPSWCCSSSSPGLCPARPPSGSTTSGSSGG